MSIDLVGEDTGKINKDIDLMSCAVAFPSKCAVLMDLVTVHAKGNKTIVFTQTKRDADEVTASLGKRVSTEVLHGDIAQAQRERTLQRFRQDKFSVLVATDVAARGLDVDNVDLVVHYELPNETESFVHRCGRTGRAGKKGTAIALHTDREFYRLRDIKRFTGADIREINPPSSSEVMAASAATASSVSSASPSPFPSSLFPVFPSALSLRFGWLVGLWLADASLGGNLVTCEASAVSTGECSCQFDRTRWQQACNALLRASGG